MSLRPFRERYWKVHLGSDLSIFDLFVCLGSGRLKVSTERRCALIVTKCF